VNAAGPVRFRDVVIVGGGCYGTFYAGQLTAARAKGRAEFHRLLVVDQDPGCRFTRELGTTPDRLLVASSWTDFFDSYLGGPPAWDDDAPPDVIVPSPLMPHLMYPWLERQAHRRWPDRTVATRPLTTGPGTPYDRLAPDGSRYVSFADWLCPTHCIEPAICPVIRAPRAARRVVELTAVLQRVDAVNRC
jgi:hypothetical protein